MQNTQQIQRAVDLIKQDPIKLAALFSSLPMGMTTQGQTKRHLADEDTTDRSIYRKLKELSEPATAHNFLPLFAGENISPVGSNGRPEKVYLLTEFGAAVRTALDPDNPVSAPRIRNQADLAHRYIILKIAEKAKENNLIVQAEHTLKNIAQEVRADVYTNIDDIPVTFEVEQKLHRRNIHRAEEKIIRWARFIKADKSAERWQIYLVFNIRQRELPTLKRYWREALIAAQEKVGELPYDLYYITASNLLDDASFFNALDNANLFYVNLEERAKQTEKSTEERQRPDDLSDDILLMFQEMLDDLLEAPPENSLAALIKLAALIHAASFSPNSPTMKSAVFPWASIWLMRRYLGDPRMADVKRALTQSLTRIHKRNPGMVMLRETVTSLLWDVLLFQHGLGRGGPLQVVFQVPDFQDRSSDFRVEVRLSDTIHEKYVKEAKALGWMLGSIYLYRQHLGLIENTKK